MSATLNQSEIASDAYSWQFDPKWQHVAKLRDSITLFICRMLGR